MYPGALVREFAEPARRLFDIYRRHIPVEAAFWYRFEEVGWQFVMVPEAVAHSKMNPSAAKISALKELKSHPDRAYAFDFPSEIVRIKSPGDWFYRDLRRAYSRNLEAGKDVINCGRIRDYVYWMSAHTTFVNEPQPVA